MRSPKAVSTSGCAEALGGAPRRRGSAPAHSSQPSCEPAPAHRAVRRPRSPSSRARSARRRAPPARAPRGRARLARTARRARAAPRGATAWVSASASGRRRHACRRRGGSRRRSALSGSSASRQPCCPSPPPAPPAARSARARRRVERPSSHSPARSPGGRELGRERAVAGGGEHVRGTTTSRRPSRSSAARRRGQSRPRKRVAPSGGASRTSCTILPGSSSHTGSSRVPCSRASARSVARATSGRSGRTCSAVISESRPKSAWKRPGSSGSRRRRRRVRPAVGREDVVEAGDAQRISLRIWWTSVSSSAPGARASPRSRATTSSVQSCVWSRRKRSIATRR